MPDESAPLAQLRACHCCGLIQRLPAVTAGMTAHCRRCDTAFSTTVDQSWTLGASLAALILYPIAMGLPVLSIERFGVTNQTDIWHGAIGLLTGGHVVVGLVVLVCSVIVPLLKLFGLIALSLSAGRIQHRHRALTYRLIEGAGRWGMIDVMLVAGVVAAVKLGDLVSVNAGPGAVIYAAMVTMSLVAGATFDPRAMWREREPVVAARSAA
ncbi:MAG: paraquat-inducible protein A [Planctomycetes bacterium]|nr:paraquat-inducible protein A [Planctomycetota bacterium]